MTSLLELHLFVVAPHAIQGCSGFSRVQSPGVDMEVDFRGLEGWFRMSARCSLRLTMSAGAGLAPSASVTRSCHFAAALQRFHPHQHMPLLFPNYLAARRVPPSPHPNTSGYAIVALIGPGMRS